MAENKVWKLTERVWETIKQGCASYRHDVPNLVFHEEKKEQFDKLFRSHYEQILNDFMTESTKDLDAHKQAAIITVCCLEAEIIEYHSEEDNKLDLLPELIAVNVGLSYMLGCLNETLKEKKVKKRIEKYYLPVAIACDTPYELIACRILRYEKEKRFGMCFNILELADRYFLLEYVNLLQHGIEPAILRKDWKK